jgi:hypothetical protein
MTRTLLKRPLRSALTVALVALTTSCTDSGVFSPTPGALKIQAAAVGALTWLAPLGSGVADPSTFDAQAVTRVEVCLWTSNACSGLPVAAFAPTPATGEGTLTRNTTAGRYEAVFNLLNTKFTTRKTYRNRRYLG